MIETMDVKRIGSALTRYRYGGPNPDLKKLNDAEVKTLFLVLQVSDFTLEEMSRMESFARSIIRTRSKS